MDRSHYKKFSLQTPWLSKSDIISYNRCPYAFYLNKIEGLQPDIPQVVKRGSRFHEWADTIYDKIDKERILNGDTTVEQEMNKYAPPGEVYQNYIQMEQKRWNNDPTETFFPYKTEEFLWDDDLMFMGTYDRLDRQDDQYVVIDYKTGQYKDYKMSGYRFELFGYKYLIEKNYDIDVDYLCVVFPDSKVSKCEPFKKQTETAFFNKVERTREQILEQKFPKTGSCQFCFMKKKCVMRSEQVI